MSRFSPKPPWLKVRAPGGDSYHHLKKTLRELDLYTVCEEARCPNVGECWREGTATVMLLGDVCTRGCRFCAVNTGDPRGVVDTREPEHVARAIAKLELQYVVFTMVNRDDLLDGGADHVARTVRRLRALRPTLCIEALVGDFCGKADAVQTCVDAPMNVFAHNVETVRRLTRSVRDVRSGYDQTLDVLRTARRRAEENATPDLAGPRGFGRTLIKSSIMVGLGETDEEVVECMRDLREVGVDIVTLGQYLRPSAKHHEVKRFVTPEEFATYQQQAHELGFMYAASGPLVRSSYKAAEVFVRSVMGDEEDSVAQTVEARLELARKEAAAVAASDTGGPAPRRDLVPASSLVRSAPVGAEDASGDEVR